MSRVYRTSRQQNAAEVRRGMAVLLVLGLLALTLTLSYAMLRLQHQVDQTQTHINGADKARLAALTGMAVALRKMHDSTWAGVDTALHASLGDGTTFDVDFVTGDASLTSGHPQYGEYPYRVTISSKGTAIDPGQPLVQTTYRVQAVAQLVRRKIDAAAVTSRWTNMNQYTVYQWNASPTARTNVVQLPCQVQGSSCFEGTLQFCQSYPKYGGARQRYLQDLKKWWQAETDYRPFTGTVSLGQNSQDSNLTTELGSWLGLTVTTNTPAATTPVTFPAGVTTYQLYPGGKVYSIPRLADVLISPAKNQVVGPNPLTNPLGIYRTDSSWTFMSGSKLTGTLLCDGATANITISGTGIQLAGVNLPPVEGTTETTQLPLVLARNDVVVAGSSASTVGGLVMAWNQFVVSAGSKATQFALNGRVFSDAFQIHGRAEWEELAENQWQQSLADFEAQYDPLLIPLGLSEEYYPRWMERSPYYLAAQPKINLVRPAATKYHWPAWGQPIYVKGETDMGLRWNIVSWSETR
jgi:hypothetical protein